MNTTTVMHPERGRPNKTAADLTSDAGGRVRPYMLVRAETLAWLEAEGTDPRHRGAILAKLLRDRYRTPAPHRPRLDVCPESTVPFRPLLPVDLLGALDDERGTQGWSRGQVVDAVVAASRGEAGQAS